VKAHIGIEGNETADKLAKEAAQDVDDQNIFLDRIPTTTVASEINMQGIKQWQSQWNSTEKGAVCRSFFPGLEPKLKMKILITREFTAIVTGHRKTKSYLHRFKLTDKPTYYCNEGQQINEHIIYEYNILETQRSFLIKHITAREGVWPPTNDELIASYINAFSSFIRETGFQKLN
jgi:hypothetical protein